MTKIIPARLCSLLFKNLLFFITKAFCLTGYLVTVPQIVPDAVETSGDARHGVEEGVATPDEKHRVLLPQGLPRTDGVMMAMADPTAEAELQHTTGETYHGDAAEDSQRGGGGTETLDAHHDGKSETDSPEIEGEILDPCDVTEKVRSEIAHEEGEEEGADEEREHLAHDEIETRPKTERAVGIDERHHGRNRHGHDEIDEYGVGRQSCHVAAEFAGDDSSCCCRGADEA